MSGNYRKNITTITIFNDTRKELRQIQQKYHLEVDDAMQLLIHIYQQVEIDYDILVHGDSHTPSPQDPLNSFFPVNEQAVHDGKSN